jgi:hypothetical protein
MYEYGTQKQSLGHLPMIENKMVTSGFSQARRNLLHRKEGNRELRFPV